MALRHMGLHIHLYLYQDVREFVLCLSRWISSHKILTVPGVMVVWNQADSEEIYIERNLLDEVLFLKDSGTCHLD